MAQYREHFERGMTAHRVITHGGEQPNVIPAKASVWWMMRHPGAEGARKLFREHADLVTLMPVDDPGVLRDIDTPQDLAGSS